MGNACRKNVDQQVEPPKPQEGKSKPEMPKSDLDDEELRKLREQNEKFKRQRDELEDELNRWRREHERKIAEVEKEMASLQEEAKKAVAAVADENDIKRRALAAIEPDCKDLQAKELERLQERFAFLSSELERLNSDKDRMEEVTKEASDEVTSLDALIARLNGGGRGAPGGAPGEDDEADDIDDPAAQEKRLSQIASYYRPVAKPVDAADCWYQTRIDCAELSTQTVRNFKALWHDIQTGDRSWYLQRPVRGVICRSMQCGDIPHDRWKCELCSLIDVSDAPLLV